MRRATVLAVPLCRLSWSISMQFTLEIYAAATDCKKKN